jgi:hypothetical protein
MTEADTFNALKHIPFNQMYDLWKDAPAPWSADIFYTQYGWTQKEFWNEYHKRKNERS